jgi:hypothetical protein
VWAAMCLDMADSGSAWRVPLFCRFAGKYYIVGPVIAAEMSYRWLCR